MFKIHESQDRSGLTEFADPGDQDPQGHQVRSGDMVPLPGHNWQGGDRLSSVAIAMTRVAITTFTGRVMARVPVVGARVPVVGARVPVVATWSTVM